MRFTDQANMAAFLCKLDEDYAVYAAALWAAEVRRTEQLANMSVQRLIDFGITNGIYAEDIKARAGMNNNADWVSAFTTRSIAIGTLGKP